MRTYRIIDWNKPTYVYDVQIEDCEKGKIISFIKTTKEAHGRDFGYAKQIDRVAVSTESLESIGLTEENIVKKLRENGEIRSILKYGEDLIERGLVRTSKVFISLDSRKQQIYVSYESYAAKHKFRLPLRKQDYNPQFLEKLAKTLDYTDHPENEILSQEPAMMNLKKVIAEEDQQIVGNTLTDIEQSI